MSLVLLMISCVQPGSAEEKSSLMFSMNDIGGTGFLTRGEFARMLRFEPHVLICLITAAHFILFLVRPRSFIEISNCSLSKVQAEDGIKAVMQAAGFDRKEKITWEDFHFLLQDHEKELQFAQLNVKGHLKGTVHSNNWSSFHVCIRIYLLTCFPSVMYHLKLGN